ncbi:MAG: nucleotidyltransferase family protein [Acidobacteria bacterium]|nr:nucleotidyltransferase family protein [Acidobacteriota bacterium]
MADPESFHSPQVTGIVLAAGLSRRFDGRLPKQLHQINGQTLVYRTATVALASKLRQIVIVVGHRGAEVGAVLAGLAIEVVVNPDFADGQSTSVKIGLSRVDANAEAAMFIPCDLPNLDAETINRLVESYAESGGWIVVPVFEGCRRAPVLIDRSLFGELRGITGDQGARQLFPRHQDDLVEVEFESKLPFADLDRIPTPPF